MLKAGIVLLLLHVGLAAAMDTPLNVKKYSFGTLTIEDLQKKSAFLIQDKAFRKAFDKMMQEGRRQIKNEEEKTAFSWCKMATATTVCLAGVGTGVAIGLTTGHLALFFPLTTAPFGFLAGWMVDKGDVKVLQEMKNKLALLQKMRDQLKKRRQDIEFEQKQQAVESAQLKKEKQYVKYQQEREFKELAQKNKKKQAFENEKRKQKEEAMQIAYAPAAITASSTSKRGCTCSTHMIAFAGVVVNELKALHEKVVALQKTSQQTYATTSSAVFYAQPSGQAQLRAVSHKQLPKSKRYHAYGRSFFVELFQKGEVVEIKEWIYDVEIEEWRHSRTFTLSYDQAIANYGEQCQKN